MITLRHAYLLFAAPLAIAGLVSTGPTHAAQPVEFEEAELYLELNDTDGDLGIHSSIDGDPYRQLKIKKPNGATVLLITAHGALRKQGLTQLFFESAEPGFDELTPEEFFERFPEGTYKIRANGIEGERFASDVDLSHVLAAPAGSVTVDGLPAAANCDALILPVGIDPVVIDWAPVTTSHPTIGVAGPVTIDRYQFFVEQGDTKFGIDLEPSVTQFTVPSEMTDMGGTFKFEIIARTDTGNNTAIESCYTVP